jgi:acyl-CoA synthetase (AMP-forming)/AMP-acid ligase II
VMKLHPAVEDCLVFGQPDERFGQRVVAVVSLAGSGSSVADEELLARAKEHLASYKLPRQIVTVDAVPRTATGKADYPEARLLFDAAVANANANANAPAD